MNSRDNSTTSTGRVTAELASSGMRTSSVGRHATDGPAVTPPRAIRATSTPAAARHPLWTCRETAAGRACRPHGRRLNQLQATNAVRKRRVGAAYGFTVDAVAEVAGGRRRAAARRTGTLTALRYSYNIFFSEKLATLYQPPPLPDTWFSLLRDITTLK